MVGRMDRGRDSGMNGWMDGLRYGGRDGEFHSEMGWENRYYL